MFPYSGPIYGQEQQTLWIDAIFSQPRRGPAAVLDSIPSTAMTWSMIILPTAAEQEILLVTTQSPI